MIPLAPALVVAAASSFIGVGEQGGDNRGQMVELFLREVNEPPGKPWCAAFVHHVGYWALYDHRARRSSWPLPRTASCWELGDFARTRGILVERPRDGDVFLLYSRNAGRFAHTGFVVDEMGGPQAGQRAFECITIEGNTNDDGSSNGNNTLIRTRSFDLGRGDRFIHWVDLDRRAQAA
jgi:hypothetical protein